MLDTPKSFADEYVDRDRLAQLLAPFNRSGKPFSHRTLARLEAEGLPRTDIAGKPVYRLASIKEWLQAREHSANPKPNSGYKPRKRVARDRGRRLEPCANKTAGKVWGLPGGGKRESRT
jgi:hypothetical protein